MCKVLYIDHIVPEREFINICKRYFGITKMTSVAEECREIKNSFVFTANTDIIYGNYGLGIKLEHLKLYNDVVLLSTLIDNNNIGEL